MTIEEQIGNLLISILENDNNVIEYSFVGSRVTCDPPPKNTDIDILILTNGIINTVSILEKIDFIITSKGYDSDDFLNMKNGKFDLIITDDRKFYKKFIKATSICKELNLLKREDRVSLFRGILYNWEVKL